MYGFVEFVIKVRWRSAWHGYQWCVRTVITPGYKHVVSYSSAGKFLL